MLITACSVDIICCAKDGLAITAYVYCSVYTYCCIVRSYSIAIYHAIIISHAALPSTCVLACSNWRIAKKLGRERERSSVLSVCSLNAA